ncbi:MAG: hypothetical protein A2W31_12210 [Planctomycetes bacterium RBG_16_64_10]|nr:MAG: hypothetical protein A2W31_12210 [Planctomycetes bacterium RBG_16_64_10]
MGTPIYSSFKPLEVIEHPLLAKGLLIEDGGGRSVLCAVDWCELCNETYDVFRARMAEAAGTIPARVAVQTVHQHTAPMADAEAIRILAASPNPPPYPAASTVEDALTRLVTAVKEATGRMQLFDRFGHGQARVERVASNRRVPIGAGKVGFRASSCRDPEFIAKPEGLIDPFVKTITFARGGAAIARVHYYATHPQSFYGDPRASYDFVGMARERLQEEERVFQIYFTGCAGDIAAGKYNDASPEARQGLFERLHAGMAASAAATEYRPASDMLWRSTSLRLASRDDAGFVSADLQSAMQNTAAAHSVRLGAAMALAWRSRVERPIELTAFQLGNVWAVHLPGEPMIDFQFYAQQQQPDACVAVAGYGDCGPAYICLDKAFGEGGYEPGAAHVPAGSEAVFRAAIRALMAT